MTTPHPHYYSGFPHNAFLSSPSYHCPKGPNVVQVFSVSIFIGHDKLTVGAFRLTRQDTQQQCPPLIVESAVASRFMFSLSKGHAALNNGLYIKGLVGGRC